MLGILFVHHEETTARELTGEFREARPDWNIGTAASAADAMTLLNRSSFDVVITDMNLPDINGAGFLKEVRRSHPDLVRILFSDHSAGMNLDNWAEEAHRYFSKPFEVEDVIKEIEKVTALRNLTFDTRLRKAVGQLNSVPSLPHVYASLIDEMQNPDASIRKVGEIIKSDIGMTVKILQLANSAFFGFRKEVSDVTDAVRFLGLDTVSSLTLAVGVFSQLEHNSSDSKLINQIWQHSTRVAEIAKGIARIVSPKVCDQAFTAGLLHEIGEVVIVANAPEKYSMLSNFVPAEHQIRMDAEREIFGATHAEIGAYLLSLWGIPSPVVEAVAFHHTPSDAATNGISALSVVHIADGLLNFVEMDSECSREQYFDLGYLESLQLGDKLESWHHQFVTAEELVGS